jgi:two-component system sensor histidine kinase KdpD
MQNARNQEKQDGQCGKQPLPIDPSLGFCGWLLGRATLLLEDREMSEEVEKLSSEEQHAMLEVINHGADRLDRFVEGIVDLARIEAGDMTLHRNWGAVDDIVDAALAQAEPLTRRHKIQVSIPEELPVVRVDARAVTEVIYTLIDNATKYAAASTTVLIEADRVADDMIKIAVEDEGPGIPAHLRGRVFERFYRGSHNGTGSDRVGGIGMGLAIAKGIVEAHSGEIRIEEAIGLFLVDREIGHARFRPAAD